MNAFHFLAPFLALSAGSCLQAQSLRVVAPDTTLLAPGGTVAVLVSADYAGRAPTALGLELDLPSGWSFVGIEGAALPNLAAPSVGDGGRLEFVYSTAPADWLDLRVTLRYPANSSGEKVVRGSLIYRSPLVTTSAPDVRFGASGIQIPFAVRENPRSVAVFAGQPATLSAEVTGTVMQRQWLRDGVALDPIQAAPELRFSQTTALDAGLYSMRASGGPIPADGVAVPMILMGVDTAPALLAVNASEKLSGAADEVGSNIVHPNGNVFDQVLLLGATGATSADPGQVTRVSFVDPSDDIVQVEFSGAGTLLVTLQQAGGPSLPRKYNQQVSYVSGLARITISGADETTNLGIFSVGRLTAVNQALFRDTETYDGIADLASIAIHSRNGRFGALRAGNAALRAGRGPVGLFAPGVRFEGPTIIHDLAVVAGDSGASAYLLTGGMSELRVAGGAMTQEGSRTIAVSGVASIRPAAGTDSHGRPIAAKPIAARFLDGGFDVTARIVRTP